MPICRLLAIASLALGTASLITDANARKLDTLYSFPGGTDPANPYSGVIREGSVLYGITYYGGTSNHGTVFKIDPVTGTETTLYEFTGARDGAYPTGLIARDGKLYGTTLYGGDASCGADGCGTVFEVEPATGAETVLYTFTGAPDGMYPNGLIFKDGGIYGTTSDGGLGFGTIFHVDANTGAESLPYRFTSQADGSLPYTLISEGDILYGTTYYGGGKHCYDKAGCGTVFKLNLKTGAKAILHTFAGGANGFYPNSLTYQNSYLYGTTLSFIGFGDECNEHRICGTVFKLDTRSGAETILHRFTNTGGDGALPESRLIYLDGKLYGSTAEGGEFDAGTVFEVDPLSGKESILYNFTGAADGNGPFGNLTFLHNALYGTTVSGGASNAGTVFKFHLKP